MNQLMSTFKLLSDESRFRIIHLLNNEELCVCQITGILEISQPKASKALSKLRDLDLVTDERRDKFVYYQLKKSNPLIEHILAYISLNLIDFDQLDTDINRLHLKESFLSKCGTTQIKL